MEKCRSSIGREGRVHQTRRNTLAVNLLFTDSFMLQTMAHYAALSWLAGKICV